ncbi:transposase, partial [Sphingomonas sp. Leaf62]|uniref:transposase n=1 Tax=Sphingomonas sp. Leaf62 TaxID=1736228 RepID=UPI001F423BC5
MSRRKEPALSNDLLDQLLAGGDAGAALAQGGLLDALKKALTERALNAEINYHLAGDDGAGNTRNGYSRKIAGHLHDLYGIDVSPDLISTVTDAVLDEVAIWQQRP